MALLAMNRELLIIN